MLDLNTGVIRPAHPGLVRRVGDDRRCYSPCTPHLAFGRLPDLPASLLNVPGLDVQQLFLSALIACIGKDNMPAEINPINFLSIEALLAAAGNYKGW